MNTYKIFPLLTNKGLISINLGQCFRPNKITKKLFHFKSKHGYGMWVMSVANDVTLTFGELSTAINKAMELVGAVEVSDEKELELEVA